MDGISLCFLTAALTVYGQSLTEACVCFQNLVSVYQTPINTKLNACGGAEGDQMCWVYLRDIGEVFLTK